MNYTRKILTVGCILILGLSACTLPSQAPNPQEQAESAVTATLLALTLSSQNNQPAGTNIPGSTPFPSEMPTLTPTFTPSVPIAKVSTGTNCRTGPGIVYDQIGVLLVGEEAVVVGKYSPSNYWIINNPDASGTCWLWGQHATISGNTDGLPEYTAPPTPTPTMTPTPTATSTPAIPAEPTNFTATKLCTSVSLLPPIFNYQFILNWDDNADNEDGYRIYYQGSLQTTLPADAITHPVGIGPLGPGNTFTYEVEAFNVTGASAKQSVMVTCP